MIASAKMMATEAPTFRHDLPTTERVKVTYSVETELHLEARRLSMAGRGSANELYCRAIEAQVREWFAADVKCENPVTGEKFTKLAGEAFPPREGGFPRGFDSNLARGSLARTSLYIDPALLEAWLDGVWYQLPTYMYPAFALGEAMRSFLQD